MRRCYVSVFSSLCNSRNMRICMEKNRCILEPKNMNVMNKCFLFLVKFLGRLTAISGVFSSIAWPSIYPPCINVFSLNYKSYFDCYTTYVIRTLIFRPWASCDHTLLNIPDTQPKTECIVPLFKTKFLVSSLNLPNTTDRAA